MKTKDVVGLACAVALASMLMTAAAAKLWLQHERDRDTMMWQTGEMIRLGCELNELRLKERERGAMP